jgi:hypothetical protein
LASEPGLTSVSASGEPAGGSSRWLILGVVAAVTLGLGAGWLILHWLRPDKF